MSSFFRELKRRNVVRVAIAYIIMAWLLLQVIDVMLQVLGLPESVGKFMFLLLIVGFPLALFFAWAFELTPEGLKREKDVDRSQSITPQTGSKLDKIIISVLALAVGFLLFDRFYLQRGADTEVVATDELRGKSIAVLPFANRSASEEDAFFVDGVHDDILMRLARISSLKVISRTSVQKFRDTDKNIQEIGQELGVNNVLEGAVQRAGNRVRITVQLIDAQTDEHLWADSYDRDLTAANVFSIQTEIAEAIVGALEAALTTDERSRIASVPTENLDAYYAYQLGRQRFSERTVAALDDAIGFFEQAIELDPEYALAYATLAEAHLISSFYGTTPRQETAPKMRAAIDSALLLSPNLGEAYNALGGFYLYINHEEPGRLNLAEQAFKKAIELNPNYPTSYHWYSILLRDWWDRPDESLRLIKIAVDLDPLSPVIQSNVGYCLSRLGKFDAALAQFERSVEIDPDYAWGWASKGWAIWQAFGRVDEAIRWMSKAQALDPDNRRVLTTLSQMYLDLEAEADATRWADRALEIAGTRLEPNWGAATLALYRDEGQQSVEYARKVLEINPRSTFANFVLRNADLETGDFAAALRRYEQAFPELFAAVPTVDVHNIRAAVPLFPVLREIGDSEQADKVLERSLAYIKVNPRLGSGGYWIADVELLAMSGERAEALAALRVAVDEGWRIAWWRFLERNPNLDSIRDEPEFAEIVAEIRADMATQLARVRAMQASGEIRLSP